MDHRYIEEHSLADRYLDRVLPPQESGEFEAHLVDCLECRDRLLLAEMFHARNGVSKPSQHLVESKLESKLESGPPNAPVPLRIRLAAQFTPTPWQLVTTLIVSAILLMLAPAVYFLWEMYTLHGRH